MRRRLALVIFFGLLSTGALAAPPNPGALKSDGVTANATESIRWGGGFRGGFRAGGWGFRGGGWRGGGWGWRGRGWGWRGRGWGWGALGLGLGLAATYPYYRGYGYYGGYGYRPAYYSYGYRRSEERRVGKERG